MARFPNSVRQQNIGQFGYAKNSSGGHNTPTPMGGQPTKERRDQNIRLVV